MSWGQRSFNFIGGTATESLLCAVPVKGDLAARKEVLGDIVGGVYVDTPIFFFTYRFHPLVVCESSMCMVIALQKRSMGASCDKGPMTIIGEAYD